MPRKLSKIICPVCKEIGGSLTLRRAGNAKRVKYFYIKHFARLAKHKNTSCYLGRTYRLADVKLNDKKYRVYEKTVESAYLYPQHHRKGMNLKIKADSQLRHMGFPRRFLLQKFRADGGRAYLKKEYENRWGKGILESENFDYERFNYKLSSIVEKILRKRRKGTMAYLVFFFNSSISVDKRRILSPRSERLLL